MKLKSFTGSTSKKKKKALLEKEKLFFFSSVIPQSTENTLFQHNLIYLVFPLASILSNMHCCPYFLGKEGKMEGGKTQMCKGSQFSCKIQLLKNKGFPPPFPLSSDQKQDSTQSISQSAFGEWVHVNLIFKNYFPASSTLCPRWTKTFILTQYILQDAAAGITQDLQYNHFKCPTANINPNP